MTVFRREWVDYLLLLNGELGPGFGSRAVPVLRRGDSTVTETSG